MLTVASVCMRSGKYRGLLVLVVLVILFVTIGLPVGVAQLLFANRRCALLSDWLVSSAH